MEINLTHRRCLSHRLTEADSPEVKLQWYRTVSALVSFTLLFLFQVLKWVEEAVQASKVHLLSTDHLEQAVNIWTIPFDPSLKEVTVSLSGPSPVIEIRNPLGEIY